MLKLGKMYTANGEYNIFILKNSSIDRLEIGTASSKWHSVDSQILYGEYTRKVSKTFGNADLGALYKNTIKNAKTIDVLEQIDMNWEDGVFCRRFFKRLSDGKYYGFVEKEGKLDSEVYMYGGVKIVLCVSGVVCNLDLEPLNFPQYKRSKKKEEIPVLRPRLIDKAYDNYLFMEAIFRCFFNEYTKSEINMDSPDELRTLLYDTLMLPVVAKDENGLVSVSVDTIRKLARIKRDRPEEIITNNIYDSNGRLVLKADRLNSAKYPAAVYLEKYYHYKELAVNQLNSAKKL